MGKNRRSLGNVLVNPRYQLRFIFWAAFACVMVIMYFGVLLFASLRQYQAVMLANASPALQESLANEYNQILFRMVGGSLVILATAVIVGLFLSHRTAGPLHQLKQAFDRVREGNWNTRVVFRDHDEFRDLGDSFNRLMDSLQKRS